MYPVLKGILQMDGEMDLQEPEFGEKGKAVAELQEEHKKKEREGQERHRQQDKIEKEKEGLRKTMKDLEEYKIMQDKYEEKWIEAEELTERRERREQERQERKKNKLKQQN